MKWLVVVGALFLSACNALQIQQLPPQPVESELFALEQLSPKAEKSLLTIHYTPTLWRWVQIDPLGAPISRLQLSQNGWQNDGFIIPNRQATSLFSAIATYLNPNALPFVFSQIQPSSQGKSYFIQHKFAWQIRPIAGGAYINLSDHSQWIVQKIE